MNKPVSYTLIFFSFSFLVSLSFDEKINDFQTPEKKSILITKDSIDGKKLFKMCSNCHGINQDGKTGPSLAGVNKRWPDKSKLYQFIRNPGPFYSTDEYVKKLLKKWKIIKMAFPLSDKELNALFGYIKSQEKKKT